MTSDARSSAPLPYITAVTKDLVRAIRRPLHFSKTWAFARSLLALASEFKYRERSSAKAKWLTEAHLTRRGGVQSGQIAAEEH
jgi:hypothetical protein